MRIIQTIVIITCIISCSNKTEDKTSCNSKFDSSELGISFNHPETWNIAEYTDDRLIEIAYDNIIIDGNAKTNRSFDISIRLIPTAFEKDGFYTLFEQKYVKAFEQMEGLIIHEKKSEIKNINDSEWKLTSFEFENPNEEPNHVKMKHLVHFSKPYSVMMSISIQDLNEKRIPNEINCFLESLKIK